MCRSAYSQFILAAIASATFVVFFSYTSRNIAAIVPVLVEPVSAHRPAAPPPVPLLSCASAPASAGLSISCSTGVMARLLFAAHGAVSGACPLPSEPVSCDGSPALPCPVYFRRSLSCDDKAFIRTASRACIGKQNCSLLPPADDPCPSVVSAPFFRDSLNPSCSLSLLPTAVQVARDRGPLLQRPAFWRAVLGRWLRGSSSLQCALGESVCQAALRYHLWCIAAPLSHRRADRHWLCRSRALAYLTVLLGRPL